MKVRILILLVLCVLLGGCSLPQQPQTEFAPEPESCLLVYTTMDKSVWEPFLLEFQEQSDLWIQLEQGTAQDLLEKMEKSPEDVDLILGCGADNLDAIQSWLAQLPIEETANEKWTPVFYQVPVIIYNPHLIQKNLPTGFIDLSDPRWQGSFAFADPNTDVLSRSVLAALVHFQTKEIPQNVLKQFSRNVGGIFSCTEKVLDAVGDGTCPLGIVPESAALNAISRGENLEIVYPEEGELLLPAAMALPIEGKHPEQAVRLMTFLIDEATQRHGWEYCNLRPVLEDLQYLPEKPIRNIPEAAAVQKILTLWNEIQENAS